MAAANTDKLKKLARRWVGQIGSGGVTDAVVTTIPLSSAANLPTTTAVVLVIDRVNANGTTTPTLEETVVGVVSGNNLVDCVRGAEGTAQAHSAGAVVELLVTAKGYNDIIDAILAGHTQLGAHTTDTISEKTATAGVTVDGLLIKDSGPTGWNGWMIADETWTYASATTITVPAGATSKYQKGDKIKLTQTSVKYFSIVSVADTVLTVTGGSDYTVADVAISANYYSKAENPQEFPDWFNWAPTYGASGSMTYTQVTTNVAKFKIIGKCCYVEFGARGTTGGTASTDITVTPPVIPVSQSFYIGGGATLYDAGILSGNWYSASNLIKFAKYNYSNWGIGGTKDIKANFFYRI